MDPTEHMDTTKPMDTMPSSVNDTSSAVKRFRKWIIIGVVGLILLIIAPFAYTSGMLYKMHQHNQFTDSMVQWFPFPAVIVNGNWILYRDYQTDVVDAWAVVDRFAADPTFQAQLGGSLPSHTEIAQTELDRMVQVELMEELAKEYSITVEAADIDTAYDDFVQTQAQGDASQIESTLQELYGWTVDQFKTKVVRELVLRQKVSDYLLTNKKEEFTGEAKTKITELQTQLQTDPSLFPELAKANSQDGSAAEGGDLGWFGKDQMVKPFEDAAFALTEANQISDIVESEYGFHLIQLIERKTDDTAGEQVHARHILIQFSMDNYLATIKEQAKVSQLIEASQI